VARADDGLSASVARTGALVIHPETHIVGELRWLIAGRRPCLRCQPSYIFLIVATIVAGGLDILLHPAKYEPFGLSARADADRLFVPERVRERISAALER
jgi:hypothetical protein